MDEFIINKNQIFINAQLKTQCAADCCGLVLSEDKTKFSIDFYLEFALSLCSITPFCTICHCYNITNKPMEKETCYLHMCGDFKHIYCQSCKKLYIESNENLCVAKHPDSISAVKSYSIIGQNEKEELVDTLFSILRLLMFKCKWPQCRKIFRGENLESHQLVCELQQEIKCPVKKCFWRGHRNALAEEHFTLHANSKIIFDNKTICNTACKNYYLLFADIIIELKYSQEQLGDVYEHSITVNNCSDFDLEISVTIISDGIFVETIHDGNHVVLTCTDNIATIVCARPTPKRRLF